MKNCTEGAEDNPALSHGGWAAERVWQGGGRGSGCPLGRVRGHSSGMVSVEHVGHPIVAVVLQHVSRGKVQVVEALAMTRVFSPSNWVWAATKAPMTACAAQGYPKWRLNLQEATGPLGPICHLAWRTYGFRTWGPSRV